jgi:type II secretion system protein H
MRATRKSNGGFTLIELILVMAMLVVVLAISAPSLGNFFRGRSLESEARQMLSLTHYAQSRASSEGAPMIVWIDAKAGAYGLQMDAGYSDGVDPKAVEYKIGEDLKLEVMPAAKMQTRPSTLNLPVLRFLPDGGISEQSAPGVVLTHAKGDMLWLVQGRTGLTYEIRDEETIGQIGMR